MRIAIVHSFYNSSVPSGENIAVEAQAELLSQHGHEVLVVSQRTGVSDPGRVSQVGSAIRVVTGRGASPESELLKFSPDVIHLHNTFPNWSTRWIKRNRSKVVVTLHNYRTLCSNALMFRDGAPCSLCLDTPVLPALRNRCYKDSAVKTLPLAVANSPRGSLRSNVATAAAHIVFTEGAKEVFDRSLGTNAVVVPNFVPRADDIVEKSSNGGWAAVGRLTPEKGIAKLAREWPDGPRLTIYGDGPEREEVAAVADMRANVNYLGSLSRDELRGELNGMAGVVIPSLCAEGLPTVALEAFSASVPCIVSTHVLSSVAMEAAGAVLTYTPGKGDLQSKVEEVAGDASYARRASEYYEANYEPGVWLRRMESLYERVANG